MSCDVWKIPDSQFNLLTFIWMDDQMSNNKLTVCKSVYCALSQFDWRRDSKTNTQNTDAVSPIASFFAYARITKLAIERAKMCLVSLNSAIEFRIDWNVSFLSIATDLICFFFKCVLFAPNVEKFVREKKVKPVLKFAWRQRLTHFSSTFFFVSLRLPIDSVY